MRFDRFLASLTLFLVLTSPLLAATKTELIPAPEIELETGEAREVEDILADLKRKIVEERPSSARVVYEWFKSAGNEIGVHGDRLTAAYAMTKAEVPNAIGGPLEDFGLAFAIVTCLEKQFVSGEPAGWDAAYETAKFLTGKVSGGGAAAVGILKYSLDTFANAAMAQIDSDFYNAYCNWQLQERPDWDFYFNLYKQPGGGKKVEAALDRFWLLSAEVAGVRGYGAMVHKYKDDLDNAKAAYRQKFLKEYLYPAMKNLWEDQQIDAEVALLLEAAKIRAIGKTKKKIRIVIPKIIDRGTANGARDLKATLIHSGRYIVAQTGINGRGAVFEFPAGKLIHPDHLKPVDRVSIAIEPVKGAQLADRHAGQISLPLVKKHPRIRKEISEDLISLQVDKPFYVHMAYPVTVKIEGGGSKITSLRTRITPGKSNRYRSGTVAGGRHTSNGNGVFEFEAMPTGKCTFTYGTRRATKMITAKEEITLEGPVQAKFTGRVSVPQKPNLAGVNTQRIQTLQQLKNFEKFEDDINNAIGSWTIKLNALKEDYLERYDIAFAALREQNRLRSQQKGLDSKQRQALQEQLRENRKSLHAAKKAAVQEFTRVRKQFGDAQKKVNRAIREEDRSIEGEYQQAQDIMYAEYKKVNEFDRQIESAVREVSRELHHNGFANKTPAEAEVAIARLEQDVASIDGLVEQIQASVDAANDARERFKAQLDAREKRRLAREQPAAKAPSILAGVEQMKLLLDSLKKNAVAQKTKAAGKTVKKRHEMRKKNAAEFARLLNELKKLSAKLPDVDPKDFDKVYRQSADNFAEVIDDPEGKAKALAKIHSKVKKFLDRNDVVIGDLRNENRKEKPTYARIETLSRQITDMVSSGLVYAGQDYHKAWEPARAKLMAAYTIRGGVGRRLIAIEKDLEAARADLDGYRSSLAATVADTEALIAKAIENGKGRSADFGTVLDTLDQAWKKSEQMPVFRCGAYQEKMIAAADTFAANGVLVNYAKAAKRPLVVFDSYFMGGDVTKETKVGKPIFRCKPGPEAYTSVSLKARVIGLPPGKAAVIAVEDDWYRYTCHRDKKSGLHFVNVTLMRDRVSQIRVLGTGKANPPIEYPFIQQVALR